MNNLTQAASLLRIHQWHKNTFVLLGFFVLGDYHNHALLVKAALIFAAFCLASSAVYIFNDYHDIKEDRAHPLKKNRPLASGAIKTKPALFTALVLFGASLGISYYVNVISTFIILLYLANNAVYSLFLKRYPIIDVFQIGLGFMLRIFAGTIGIGIFISEWMIITGFMISLLIGFSKRYGELSNNPSQQSQRYVLKEYSLEILKAFMIIMSSATIITYSLYTLSQRSIELHGTTDLIYTIPLVIFGVFRYLYLVMFNQSGDDPASHIVKDKQLMITVVVWALLYGLIIM